MILEVEEVCLNQLKRKKTNLCHLSWMQ